LTVIMASDELKAVRSLDAPVEGGRADHGREPALQEAPAAEVRLDLADLIGDDNGEIVLFNDSGLRSLTIQTDAVVVDNGRAAAHITAGGEDVTGFNFVAFDHGLTLYFEEGLDLVIAAASNHSPN
jgi:hypothetical protein